jgi:hypothetical protein
MSCNQVIKLKQHNINYINQIRFIKLLRDDCQKLGSLSYINYIIQESRRFESMYTLQRKT